MTCINYSIYVKWEIIQAQKISKGEAAGTLPKKKWNLFEPLQNMVVLKKYLK